MKIRIPHNFEPRPYQVGVIDAMEHGAKRIVAVWHRRAGKDKTFFNLMITQAFERIGNYYYFLPTYQQGRKIIWDGKDKAGFPFLAHIPQEVTIKRNVAEMKIELVNGSMIQLIGTDNYNSIMGTNPVGCVFSEYSLQDPAAWDFIRPILRENEGWALFNFTPRGRQHGWDLYQTALKNPEWYIDLLTVDDTGVLTKEDIQAERDAGMPEELIRQEFYCSFDAGSENCVIPLDAVLASIEREVEPDECARVAGIDVARFGDDDSAIVVRQGNQVTHMERWNGRDTVETVGRVLGAYRAGLFDRTAVDSIGIGAGVADQLRHEGLFPVLDVNVGIQPEDKSRYNRLRDELWFNCRKWFVDGDCSIVKVPLTNQLTAELSNPTYDFAPNGRIRVEPKDKMKDRGGGSPDLADALCLTFYEPETLFPWLK